jgi:hypothetical protein
MPRTWLFLLLFSLLLYPLASAQDAATGAIHGTVVDLHDLRIPGATVAVVNISTGARYSASPSISCRPATTPPASKPRICRRKSLRSST